MFATFSIVLFLVAAFAIQYQPCRASFALRRDPGISIGIDRSGCSPVKLHQYGHHQYRRGIFHVYGGGRSHHLSALANPSIGELSTSIAKLQGQLNELSHILHIMVPQEDVSPKPLPIKQGNTNGKPLPSGVSAKGGKSKIAGTVQSAPQGVDLVRVDEARARIEAFLSARGGNAATTIPPATSAPSPAAPTQHDVTPPNDGTNADGFAIKLHWSGQDYSFSCPEDKTILEAAMDNDLDLPHSCMSGSCLTCPGRIKSGTVDQSDGILEEDQLNEGYLLTCVSYPKSNLDIEVLDENELL